ncbi:MAG: putative signal transducing protein [Flavobacteriales bacterium]
MEADWVKVHSSTNKFRVQFLRSLLFEHGIQAVLLDQQDTFYTSIGEVHLYVERDDAMKARNLIKKAEEK